MIWKKKIKFIKIINNNNNVININNSNNNNYKKAKKYRDDLNELLNMDFDNPNEKLINLSRKEGFNLKDKNIQK